MMTLPSPAGDSASKAMLTMAQCRCIVMLMTMPPSHAGVGAIEATWPRCDVDVESC
jgi:hypothetical protein